MRGLVVDCFAGGGGASTSLRRAFGRDPDIAINHDPDALAMHAANHPATEHLINDVWKVDPVVATRCQPVAFAWFSPDCTHHSKAKGGKPRRDGKGSRDLGWVVVHWARRVRPSVISVENVEEYQDWGPLDINGQPCPHRKGQIFKRWVRELRRLGYRVEWRELRACDFGAPTIRKRLIVVARCDGAPIVWPEPTHAPANDPRVLSGELKPYRPAADIIDWSIPCPSIFMTREEARDLRQSTGILCNRPLADNTMKRIAKGVVRYVLENPDPFLVVCNHSGDGFRGQSLDDPMATVAASRDAHGLVVPVVTYAQQGGGNRNVAEPLHTICASSKDQNALAVPFFVPRYGERPGQEPRTRPVTQPAPVIVPTGNGASLIAPFLAQHNTGVVGHDARKPVSTIIQRATTQAEVAPHLLNLKGSDRRASSASEPHPTICAGGGHAAQVSAFLVKYYGTAQGQALTAPLHTATSKGRFGLVTVQIGGEPYALVDIGMRMLTPRELFRAQGFPDDYDITSGRDGRSLTLTAQRRMCGNSVCPDLAAAVAAANRPNGFAARDTERQLELAVA